MTLFDTLQYQPVGFSQSVLGRISPKYGTHQRKLGTVMPCVERPVRRPNINIPKENEKESNEKNTEAKAVAPFIASASTKKKAGVRQRPVLKDQNTVGCQAVHITSPTVSLHCPFQEIVITRDNFFSILVPKILNRIY